jgi:anti-sigma factor RsiW
MISCYQLSLIISEFIDGELSDDICVEVREHIAYCPDCRREHEQYVKLLTFFHCHCTLKVPDQTHEDLMQLLFSEFEEQPKSLPSRKKKKKQ